ncbi:hypothetical protein QL285_068399 [Trifolium repens]|jgi:hypothetical protein|nr:hypothetical protein QL285_068399 [Trifolium repens]
MPLIMMMQVNIKKIPDYISCSTAGLQPALSMTDGRPCKSQKFAAEKDHGTATFQKLAMAVVQKSATAINHGLYLTTLATTY